MVSPRPITITADSNQSKVYGNTDPTLTYTVQANGVGSGLVGSDTFSGTLSRASGENVGTYAIGQGTLANSNYTITFVPASFSIIARPITLTATAQSTTYGSALNLGTSAYTITSGSLANSDAISAVTLQYNSSATVSGTTAAGTYTNGIVASGATGTGLSNYTISYVPGTLTVSQKALTVTASGQSTTYGSALALGSSAFTTSGLVNGDTVSAVTLNQNSNTTVPATQAAGSYTGAINGILASGATGTGLSNYTISYVPGALTVSPATLTVTADAKTMVYGATVPSLTYTITGYVNSENANTANVTGAPSITTAASSTSNVGNYTISAAANSLAAPNYIFAYTNGNLSVTPATLTYVATPTTSIYGATPSVNAGTVTGFVNSDTLSNATTGTLVFSTTATANSNVNSYAITGSGLTANNGNYVFVQAAGNSTALTINPATLTYVATPTTSIYGATPSVNAGTVTGFVNSDTLSNATTGTLVFSTTATANSNVNSYAITGSGLTANNGNYVFVQAAGNSTALTINPATLTITANNQTATYGSALSVGAGSTQFTSVGLQNNETIGSITLASSGASNTANVGSYSLVPSTATGGTFAPSNYTISYVPGTLTVSPATLTVTADAKTMVYGATVPSLTYTITGYVNSENANTANVTGAPSITTAASSTSNVGNYTISAAANSLAAPNYIFAYTNGNLSVTPATLTYVATPTTSIYGATPSVNAGTVTGFVNSDTLSNATTGTLVFSTTATANSNVNSYAITGSGLTANNGNYVFVQAAGNSTALTINPATLTITANNQTATYGSALSVGAGSTQFTSVGLQNNETIGSITLASSGASNTANVGSYSLVPSTATGGTFAPSNYTISYVPGALTVSPATITVSGSLVYNGTATISAGSLTATGVNGQTFTVSGTADLSSKNVQTNQPLADVNGLTLTANSSASLSNYYPLTVANTSVSVTPLSVTLSAPTINKVYDGSYNYTMTSADLAALSSQLVGGDTVTAASVAFAGNNPNVGGNRVVNLLSATINDGNNGANYNVSLVSSTNSQITPAPLTVTAVNSAKFVTQADPVGYGGAIYTGFVNGETASVLAGSLSISSNSTSSSGAGTYTLTPSGYGAAGSVNGNYQITYQTGTFTIVPAQNLIVTVAPTTATYSTTPTYTLTAQYLASNTASIVYLGTGNTTPSTAPITLTVSGSTPITVNDGANGSATFTIVPTSTTLSGSGNVVVGGYNVAASNTHLTGANFLGFNLVGSLTVTPMVLSASQLGVSGVSRVYNGGNAITGLALNTSPTLSAVLSGDSVSVVGTGTFDNANVGTNKGITLNVSLTGPDAGDYALSSNQLTSNTGTITQLASVTYVGTSGGNWSNASNWAGGAIPTLNNVANVIIPTGMTVVYDNAALVGQIPTSAITDNGTIAFTGSNNFTFANAVSGSGSINQSGAGVLTISGNNTYSGGTYINSSSLIVGSNNALGAGPVISTGGTLAVVSGVTLPSLSVNGSVTVTSDVTTSGNQTYDGAVTLGSGATALTSNNGNITFDSTLLASASSFTNQQSLALSAPNGEVTFGDTVGANVVNTNGQYLAYSSAYFNSPNFDNLEVTAATILIKGNITTFGTQTYNGSVRIGDNGSNGMTRILISEDPAITFGGTVDDAQSGTHNLVVEAITTVPAEVPAITFTQAVGSIAPLASLTVKTGEQNTGSGAVIADTSINPYDYTGNITIAANVVTTGNQTYTANTIGLGNNQAGDGQIFTTHGGVIAFNTGLTANNGGIAPLDPNNYSLGFILNNGTVTGLGNSGINYQLIVIPPPAPPGGNALFAASAINAGVLQNTITGTTLVSYTPIADPSLDGSVSVGQPTVDCFVGDGKEVCASN